MPVEFGIKPNIKVNDIRAPMRAAFDDLSAAITSAYASVDTLSGRLDPVLGPLSECGEGCTRPSYGAPLLEEAHQLVDRVEALAATVRSITERLVL